jgi:hypothetical protein
LTAFEVHAELSTPEDCLLFLQAAIDLDDGNGFFGLDASYCRCTGHGRHRRKGRAESSGWFNAKGMVALYVSVSFLTAIREANQAGSLQPTTLVSYQAECPCRHRMARCDETDDPAGVRNPGVIDCFEDFPDRL